MPIKELEDLTKLLTTDADRAALEEILGRNTAAMTRVQSMDLIYKATLEGNADANRLLEEAMRKGNPNPANPNPNPNPSATNTNTTSTIDINALLAEVDKKISPLSQRLDKDLSDDRIKTLAKAVALELAPELLAQSTKNSDEVYRVRASHAKEFGEELDTDKFTEFLNLDANKGKYATLNLAHDAYVHDKRIEKIKLDAKAEGRKEAEAERANANLPGSTIPSSSQLASMFAANPANKTAAGTGRGEMLDKAAAAFRSLQAGRAN